MPIDRHLLGLRQRVFFALVLVLSSGILMFIILQDMGKTIDTPDYNEIDKTWS